MTALVSFGLRAIFGAIAGCLKMPPFILGALARGKAPPAYSADGIELGAAVLRHTVSRDLSSGGADDFRVVGPVLVAVFVEGEYTEDHRTF